MNTNTVKPIALGEFVIGDRRAANEQESCQEEDDPVMHRMLPEIRAAASDVWLERVAAWKVGEQADA